MIHDDYFRLMLRAMRRHARYSPEQRSWVIPSLDTKVIALEHWAQLPFACESFEDFLCEGMQRGLWEVNMDVKTGMNVVVMK